MDNCSYNFFNILNGNFFYPSIKLIGEGDNIVYNYIEKTFGMIEGISYYLTDRYSHNILPIEHIFDVAYLEHEEEKFELCNIELINVYSYRKIQTELDCSISSLIGLKLYSTPNCFNKLIKIEQNNDKRNTQQHIILSSLEALEENLKTKNTFNDKYKTEYANFIFDFKEQYPSMKYTTIQKPFTNEWFSKVSVNSKVYYGYANNSIESLYNALKANEK